MRYEVLDLLKRHAIQVFPKRGTRSGEIGELVGVGKRSVQRVVGEPVITHHDTVHERTCRAKPAGYDGAKSALYALARVLRAVTPRPIVRFEGLPGEFTQHDFGEVLVHFLDGTKKRIHFFASRLKYSRWVEVTTVANQQVETLTRG